MAVSDLSRQLSGLTLSSDGLNHTSTSAKLNSSNSDNNPSSLSSLSSLPNELLELICCTLEPFDLARFVRVCQHANHVGEPVLHRHISTSSAIQADVVYEKLVRLQVFAK